MLNTTDLEQHPLAQDENKIFQQLDHITSLKKASQAGNDEADEELEIISRSLTKEIEVILNSTATLSPAKKIELITQISPHIQWLSDEEIEYELDDLIPSQDQNSDPKIKALHQYLETVPSYLFTEEVINSLLPINRDEESSRPMPILDKITDSLKSFTPVRAAAYLERIDSTHKVEVLKSWDYEILTTYIEQAFNGSATLVELNDIPSIIDSWTINQQELIIKRIVDEKWDINNLEKHKFFSILNKWPVERSEPFVSKINNLSQQNGSRDDCLAIAVAIANWPEEKIAEIKNSNPLFNKYNISTQIEIISNRTEPLTAWMIEALPNYMDGRHFNYIANTINNHSEVLLSLSDSIFSNKDYRLIRFATEKISTLSLEQQYLFSGVLVKVLTEKSGSLDEYKFRNLLSDLLKSWDARHKESFVRTLFNNGNQAFDPRKLSDFGVTQLTEVDQILDQSVIEEVMKRSINPHDDLYLVGAKELKHKFIQSSETQNTIVKILIPSIISSIANQQITLEESTVLLQEYNAPTINESTHLLPANISSLITSFNIHSIDELYVFINNNVDFVNYLLEDKERVSSITNDDLKHIYSHHITLLEGQLLKQAGIEISELESEEDYKNAYMVCIEKRNSLDSKLLNKFKDAAETFGYLEVFQYLDRREIEITDNLSLENFSINREIILQDIEQTISLFNISKLTKEQFYKQILLEVKEDHNTYDGMTASQYINTVNSKINKNFENVINAAHKYSNLQNVNDIQTFIQSYIKTEDVFASWKNLKGYLEGAPLVMKIQSIDQNIHLYPKNSELEKLVTLGIRPQVGDKLIDSLIDLSNFDFNKDISPIISSQGDAAFLYFNSIKNIPNFENLKPTEIEYITFIGKKHGTQARNILENILANVTSISDEKLTINDFIDDIKVMDYELYEKYKALKNTGNNEGIVELKQSIFELQSKIYLGELEEADYSNPLYSSISYYTFPPAIGITQSQYQRLNHERPDRRDDVPKELNELQYHPVSVKTGRYLLGENEELELENWDILNKAVKKVNQEYKNNSPSFDTYDAANTIIKLFKTKNLKDTDKAVLFETMYKYYRFKNEGILEDNYELSQQGLMKYKEFIGEQIKNNLIRECLSEYKEKDPEEFDKLKGDILNRLKKQQNQNVGIVKSMLSGIRRQTNEEEKNKAIEKLDDFLRDYGLSYFEIKDKKVQDFEKQLVLNSTVSEEELVYGKIASDLVGGINKSMRKEIEKFQFTSDQQGEEEKQTFQLVISKKKEHGVAGYNMGVCVTPDEQLWNDKSFWNVIIFDPVTKQALGGVHFLIRDNSLTLPGINPSLDLLARVDNQELFNIIIDYAKQVQHKLNLSSVYIPSNPMIHSNRSQMQEIIRDKNYPKHTFAEKQSFSYSPHEYSFNEAYIV